MPNTCTTIITRGKNKGKMCKDVNQHCKHRKYICDICGLTVSYRTSYVRHMEQHKDCKPKLKVKQKTQNTQSDEHPVDHNIGKIMTEMKRLQEMVTQINNRPTVVNNVNNVNIQVIIHDYYGALRDKIGNYEAMAMLTNIAKNAKPMAILDQLYFNDKQPIEYPIASHNDQVRYLTDAGEIAEENLDAFADKLSDKLTTAMLEATNQLIKENVATGDVDSLYDVYDIGKVHHNLANMHKQKGQFKTDLRSFIEVPNHPYFDNSF